MYYIIRFALSIGVIFGETIYMKQLITLIFTLFTFLLSSQENCNYHGVIKDEITNEPLPYISIYIQSVSKSYMTNEDGEFNFELPCGKYEAKIQSLGHATLTYYFSEEDRKSIILLKSNSNELPEFVVDANAEDPAFYIMRKAIVMSEFYKKQILEYSCDIYLKEVFDVGKTPEILKLFTTKEDIDEIKAGSLSETYLSYSFEQPNNITESILSRKTSNDDTTSRASSFFNFDFYKLGGDAIVSPFSKNAFQVYDFKLDNSYEEDGVIVKKIKIIPKREGQDLMRGYLYINEYLWNINRVDVAYKQNMINVDYKQIYTEIEDQKWFPINHDISVEAKFLGFEGSYKYRASISDVKIGTDSLIDEKINSLISQSIVLEGGKVVFVSSQSKDSLSKTERKINDLMIKEKLTKAETFKMLRLIKKQDINESKSKESEKSLEVKLVNRNTSYADSAFKQKSNTWDTIRKVPLTAEEREMYARNDSLKIIKSKINSDTTFKKRSKKYNIFLGSNKVNFKNKNINLSIPGVLGGLGLSFNTVDGLLLAKNIFDFQSSDLISRRLTLKPKMYYAFSRDYLMWSSEMTFLYSPKNRGKFRMDVGDVSEDFNSNQPISGLMNTASTLLFVENHKKYYQNEYFHFQNQIDIINGLEFDAGFLFENRSVIYNNSDFKIFKSNKEYTRNLPSQNFDSTVFQNNKSAVVSLGVSFTPNNYYLMEGKEKKMLNSKYPTLSVKYSQGINSFLGSNSDFGRINLSIKQSRKIKLIDRVEYFVGVGKFLSQKTLSFSDFKHFATLPFYVSKGPKTNSFRLLDYYNYSTSNYYIEGHFRVEDNHILLKRLPFVNRRPWTETLSISYLKTDKMEYTEIGYSLNKLFLILNVEIFSSFKDYSFDKIGMRVILNL